MIELPKYSTPTYNPLGLAVNERTDFTRRIPALPEKQLARDAKIVGQIIRAYEAGDNGAVLDIFRRKARLLSNPRYWEVMRTVWVAVGSTETAPLFRLCKRQGIDHILLHDLLLQPVFHHLLILDFALKPC